MVQFEYVVYEISEKINGMIRSPNDGVHLETPQAQTGSSSEGVRSATEHSTSSFTPRVSSKSAAARDESAFTDTAHPTDVHRIRFST